MKNLDPTDKIHKAKIKNQIKNEYTGGRSSAWE